MTLGAGDLNRRIHLQVPTRTSDGQGGYVKGWSPEMPLWAQMIPLRSQEAVAYNLQTSGQLWKVTIRHRTDVTTECRLKYDSQLLNIRSAQDPDGKRKWVVMTCESGVRT